MSLAKETTTPAPSKSSEMIIEKVKFTKDGAEIIFKSNSVIKDQAVQDGNRLTRSREPHPDLLKALKALVPHYLLITGLNPIEIDADYLQKRTILTEENEQIKSFTIYGFSLTGEGDSEGVVLLGKKKTPAGKTIAIPAPGEGLSGEKGYQHKDILSEDLNEVIEELEAYIGGKFAPDPQLALALVSEGDGR